MKKTLLVSAVVVASIGFSTLSFADKQMPIPSAVKYPLELRTGNKVLEVKCKSSQGDAEIVLTPSSGINEASQLGTLQGQLDGGSQEDLVFQSPEDTTPKKIYEISLSAIAELNNSNAESKKVPVGANFAGASSFDFSFNTEPGDLTFLKGAIFRFSQSFYRREALPSKNDSGTSFDLVSVGITNCKITQVEQNKVDPIKLHLDYVQGLRKSHDMKGYPYSLEEFDALEKRIQSKSTEAL